MTTTTKKFEVFSKHLLRIFPVIFPQYFKLFYLLLVIYILFWFAADLFLYLRRLLLVFKKLKYLSSFAGGLRHFVTKWQKKLLEKIVLCSKRFFSHSSLHYWPSTSQKGPRLIWSTQKFQPLLINDPYNNSWPYVTFCFIYSNLLDYQKLREGVFF